MARKLLPVLIVPLLLVAACGTSDDALRVQAGSAVEALQQAPDAAAKAGSAHIDLSMTMTMPGASTPVEITGTGDYDTEAGVAAMELDYGALFSALGGLGGQQLPAGADQPMRIVVDDTTMYLDVPFLAALTGKAGWLSVPLDEAGGSGLSSLGAGADPSAMLDYLRGAGTVTEEGSEDIDGVATTKYTATIDLAKALDKVPAAERDKVQAQIDRLDSKLSTLPVTVWVDDEGLPRRMTFTMDAPQMGAMAMTMSWSKYGEPVSVEIPDPADVTPASDIFGGLSSSLGQS